MEKEIGVGVGGGIIGALISFFGLRERVKRLEKVSVTTDKCEVCRQGTEDWKRIVIERLDKMDRKIDVNANMLHELVGELKRR